jgi:hypothetical protein
MPLFKVNGHYLTYVEGYIEAEDSADAQQKAKYGRHWKTNPNTIPIQELAVNYITEVDTISAYSALKTQPFYNEQ